MSGVTLAFSHNPDDLVDWIWVTLAFGVFLAFLAVIVFVLVRWLTARRR